MDYERKDSMKKAKSGKEPQKLDLKFEAGKPSGLQAAENKRNERRAKLEKLFNKVRKDPF